MHEYMWLCSSSYTISQVAVGPDGSLGTHARNIHPRVRPKTDAPGALYVSTSWDWHYQIAEFWFVVAMVQQDDRRSWIYKAAARRPN